MTVRLARMSQADERTTYPFVRDLIVRYKMVTDPTSEEVRKLCLSMRRNAKDERVLFHYNGHGVPRPTNVGEIWVFNKNYTQV